MEPRERSQDPIAGPRWLDVDKASRYVCMSGVDPDHDINWQDGTVHVIGKFRKEKGA